MGDQTLSMNDTNLILCNIWCAASLVLSANDYLWHSGAALFLALLFIASHLWSQGTPTSAQTTVQTAQATEQ